MRLRATPIWTATVPLPAGAAGTRLRAHWLLLAQVAWLVVAALALGLFVAGIPSSYAAFRTVCTAAPCLEYQLTEQGLPALRQLGLSLNLYAAYSVAIDTGFALIYGAVAALIFWRKAADRLALFASLALLTFGTATFLPTMNILTAAHPAWRIPVAGLTSLGAATFSLFLYLFPDGRFVPRWTRWAALAWIAWQLPRHWFPEWRDALMTGSWPHWIEVTIWPVALGTVVYAQSYRYRRVSTAVQRQQTKWVVLGMATALTCFLGITWVLAVFAPAPTSAGRLVALLVGITFIYLAMLCIPVAIGIAMLRHHLFDVDLLINRALVYGTLTAGVLGLNVLIVSGAGALFQVPGNVLLAVVATAVVAVLVQPLRDWLQRGVNRLLYGESNEPYAVLARLGARLEATLTPDAVLPTIVETIALALKLPYAAITLRQGDAFVSAASYGAPAGEPLSLALVYQAETIGQLILCPRAPGDAWTAADRRLLDDLAHQVAVAAHAVRLTAELQRARERLVLAREEERRRLRRDLHDGLGPQLASQTLTLAAAAKLLPGDPAAAEGLLAAATAHAQAAITDIRRVVYALRPPTLDDLGLVAALREQAAQYHASGVRITINAPARLPPLPAAVEVASYRIVQEALTNVVRHARARTCVVTLTVGDALCLEVRDDGRGLPDQPAGFPRRAGLGLTSMRERAEELGGVCVVEPGPAGGARVLARLPLPHPSTGGAGQ